MVLHILQLLPGPSRDARLWRIPIARWCCNNHHIYWAATNLASNLPNAAPDNITAGFAIALACTSALCNKPHSGAIAISRPRGDHNSHHSPGRRPKKRSWGLYKRCWPSESQGLQICHHVPTGFRKTAGGLSSHLFNLCRCGYELHGVPRP